VSLSRGHLRIDAQLNGLSILGWIRIDFPVTCKVDSADPLGTNFISCERCISACGGFVRSWKILNCPACFRAMDGLTMRLTKPMMRSSLSFLAVAIAFGTAVPVPAQTNPSAGTANRVTLISTRWKLIDLAGRPVRGSGFESYFALKANEQRIGRSTGQLVNASADGCNRLTGSYETNGNSLRIDVVTKTLLVCHPSRIPSEQGHAPTPGSSGDYTIKDSNQADLFVFALKGTSGFTIHGSTLELQNHSGMVLTRLEAAEADHQ
jgi:heat shock protein HslJ